MAVRFKSSLSTALLSSSSLNYFLSASRKPSFRFFHLRFSSLSRTLPLFPRRHVHTLKVLAMAERSMKTASHSHKYTNRLAAEHSPYLLQHAHNPVDWYPWGEEAFSESRKRDVPIFLSSRFSFLFLFYLLSLLPHLPLHFMVSDGWKPLVRCHVMEVESFENEGVAKLLNDWFVSIKVDREERPDVDKVYMTYVQALYGGGGWPLSVFLSPDLKPLMGGTYFPPDDKYGRPGFKTVLRKVKDAWENKRDVLVKSGAFAIEQLSEALSATASSNNWRMGYHSKHCIYVQSRWGFTAVHKYCSSVDRKNNCLDPHQKEILAFFSFELAGNYDPEYGGFGSAPKFPRPVEIQLMLYHYKKLEESGKSGEANEVLKMVAFSLQCMARGGVHDHIGGGFHRYSVDECWHVPHFEKMLYDQGQLANAYLDDQKVKYFQLRMLTVLNLKMLQEKRKEPSTYGPVKRFVPVRRKLFDVRLNRPRPHLDDKVLASPRSTWKLQRRQHLFIRKWLYDEQTRRLRHSFRNGPSKAPGFLDDYAFLISGLLDIYEFGGNTNWLDELFLDKEGGGYFNTPGEDPSVLLRVKEDHDGAEPSGNSVSVINLVRLTSMVAGSWFERPTGGMQSIFWPFFETRLKDMAMAVPLMCCGADMFSVPSRKQVVLVGHKSSVEFEDMLAAAHAQYDPNRTVIHIDPTETEQMEFWEAMNSNIALMAKNNFAPDKVVALVCQNFTCSSPVTDSTSLKALLCLKPSSA
ncbi:Spermatogenesis-associated protein 20 [Vitis vinifera]|uniref:Spermatogenesis-associated protein 20 n=1 Tax=Vitis vinifera TaxID=29760 RepID=A0A438KHV7_VITVI|nr:Spermatogenesis-associated protein 20 [Vitis vinifera]